MKINFTYGNATKDGFVNHLPLTTNALADSSVTEICGDCVIDKVPDLVAFVEECYRILIPDGVATFTNPYYGSVHAWTNPLSVRGVCEATLNFASRDWREQYKFSDAIVRCDFEVAGNFAIAQECLTRADEAKQFWMQRYLNVVQSVILTLKKKVPV